ncbi:MAG: GatB/YqeY domain-containing protein [Verrucomicrobiota bacterium]
MKRKNWRRFRGYATTHIMSLVQQIDEELKQAMKAKAAETLSVLRMLKSAVKYAAIEKHGADGVPTDVEVLTVVRKEAKKRQDSIESFRQGGREDLAKKEESELKILEKYLPKGMSEVEAEKLVKEVIVEVGATTKAQMGAVMKAAQAKAEGRVDNKTLSMLVQKILK